MAVPRLLHWLLLLVLCVWAYLPGLDGPSMLDDGVNLDAVEILGEHPEFFFDVVRGNFSGPLGRPLSMLTFSLEKVYFDAGLYGSKLLNLFLHTLIATVLLGFSRDIFERLGYQKPWLLALLVSGLWLLSPLSISTVLYVVQRIAQLVTLLSLLALWAYLRSRISVGIHRWTWAMVAVLATLAAPFAKENGLLVVPMLCLLEWQVLRFEGLKEHSSSYLKKLCLGILSASLLGMIALVMVRPDAIFSGFEARNFDLFERLLSQGRVLWAYVFQLLWTDTAALGLFQDGYPVSRSVVEPMTTLWALLAWLLVCVLWVYCAVAGRLPGVVFGLAMFITAHAMESSIFPLEIYFEHRNYLPSVGLFIAAISLGAEFARRAVWSARWLLALYFLVLSHTWFALVAEAEIWSSSTLLHMSQINRFPNSLRANAEMARVYATAGEINMALSYSRRAHDIEGGYDLGQQLMDLHLRCLSAVPIKESSIATLSAQAEDFVDDAASEQAYLLIRTIIANTCTRQSAILLANRLKHLTELSEASKISPKMYVSLAILENHIERYVEALAYVDALLARSPDSTRALMMKLYFTSLLDLEFEHQNARRQLMELQQRGLLNQQQQYNLNLFIEDGVDTQ